MKSNTRKVVFDVDPEIARMADEAVKEGRTLDLKSDIVFKSLFSKETEASNAVLRFLIASVTNQKVTKVKVLNPEITPDIITGKRVVLDVRCEFNNGLQADVEMQKADEGKGYDLLKRMTAYNASQISSQMEKGEQWNELNTCYQITILGYKYFDDTGFHHAHTLYDKQYKTECDSFQLHTLELTKLKPLLGKPVAELSDDEICGILIMYGGDTKYREYINTLSKRKEEIAMALNTLDTMSKDRKEWEMNFSRFKAECDYNSFLDIAKKNGIAIGEKQGIAIGEKTGERNAKIETARKFILMKIPLEQIAEGTGLTLDEVKQLASAVS